MNKYVFSGVLYGEQCTLERISKKKAKKMFDAGATIYLQTSKFRPFGVWSQAMPIEKADESFESVVNSFEYYNCGYEQGYYTHFYRKI